MATYPNKEFQEIYDSIVGSMGDDATLRANIEGALRPLYDQSVEQLRQQRIANNAAIDVDAASRGMGNSTWVTDAKLRQLRGESDNLATLNANYNNQLYSALLDAIKDRDNNAYNQAMQWWQINRKGGSGGSGGASNLDWLLGQIGQINETQKVNTPWINDQLNPPKGVKAPNRAVVNPWNFNITRPDVTQYTK